MNIQLLGAGQADQWDAYLRQVPRSDIYFTAGYARIYEENGDGEAQLFIYERDGQFVCYPYLLRNISDLPVVARLKLGHEVYDISTPYGYGGPLTNVVEPADKAVIFREFESVFHAYCEEKHIITEFVRFHPILNNALDYEAVDPCFVRNTIYINLDQSEEDMQRQYSRDNRNRIRRALKEGLTVAQADTGDLEQLLALYYSTMDKKQAQSYYYFSEQFFANTVQILGDQIGLVEVKYGDKVIASAMFMYSGEFAHYHLMGSDRQYLPVAPINLLIHYAATQARERGYRYMHLGGGYTGNDNLFRFKRSFNEKTMADFYIGKRIHCESLYQAIIEPIAISMVEQNYFPLYRHPELQEAPISSILIGSAHS
ncbi:GNAT family N-acetyltransferase [Paenibacillus sp. WQ 127069]|uniref:Lipid II:glycine glycyltransferase n=1 Tax=Paenibacillus baimaensis TaxID=2982185 RepID=A0ABT2UHW2_9BACL|nr:GNAT family N-acetyltransferase [Paenibacillus sp. WQ 127069]MCU6794228.1 GNAT family N-acetyltransferase [Paenibacillus sp. WQ 127069]